MAQLKDLIVNGPARIIGDFSGANAVFGGNLNPLTNTTYDLGTNSLKWRAIYATTFYGAFSGTASNATTAGGAITASYANSSGTAAYANAATTAGYASTANRATIAASATTASNATTAGYSTTAAYAASISWGNVTNKTTATSSTNGLMSSTDKIKLDGLYNTTAYCNTAAGTAAKTAVCDGYALTANSYLHIIFTNANSANSKLTLNVNTQGAKDLYINGTVSSSTNKTLPAGSYLVYYDGTYYYIRTDGLIPYSANSIDGVSVLGNGIDAIHFAVCGTAGNTAAKVADCAGFKLVAGSRIIINFVNTNTGTNPTLNVNGTGGKNIKYNGNYINAGLLTSNSFLEFVYDGTDYQYVGMTGGSQEIKIFESGDTSTTAYYIIGQAGTSASSSDLYKAAGATTANGFGIYYTPKERVLYGAAWNDYAEFRQPKEENIEPGRVVKENGDGTLSLTIQRLERGCEIVSDTYGFSIGKNNNATLPIAVSGRVLAYPDKNPNLFTIGAPVCSGLNGTVSEMSAEEEMKYPSRIIGTVSEIPNYEIWHGANDIEVNGRIWIRIR